MNRHGHHDIRNGIVWAQTGHSTGTCTATFCVIENWTHQKFEPLKKFPLRQNSNSNLLINSQNPRNRSNLFSAEWYFDVSMLIWIVNSKIRMNNVNSFISFEKNFEQRFETQVDIANNVFHISWEEDRG